MKIIECIQYSPEWWEARRGVPSASNFDTIITPKTGKLSASADDYIAELIAERVCLTPNFFSDRPQSPAMQHGSDTEPEARRFYEMDRGVEVRQVGFCMTDDDRFGCSPDGLIDPDGCLELKAPALKTQVKYLLAGTLPDEYKPQVHGQLIVTGRKWVDFMSYNPSVQPFLIRVEPDAFTRELRVALEQFHAKYVATLKRITGGT